MESKSSEESKSSRIASVLGGRGRSKTKKKDVEETISSPTASAKEGKSVGNDEEEPTQVQYKVILLGDGSVGKTSIATRFSQNHFKKTYKQTIGLDFFIKRLVLPGEIHVAVQIWDIGGQSIGSKMISNYIYGADAILLCYDVTSYQSFQNLEDWFRLVKRTYANRKLPYTALVANKIDLNHLRVVTMDQHNNFADENEFFSYQMSAKSGDKVKLCFHRVAADLAGVALTRPEFQVAHQVVKAEIIEHEKDDQNINVPLYPKRERCIIS